MNPLENGLPGAPDAERSILGGILLDNELWFVAAEALRAEHFYLDSHRRIFAAMAALAEDGQPIETIMLSTVLGARKELESVGGVAYLVNLTDGVPRRQSIIAHLRLVREKAALREIINASNLAVSNSLDRAANLPEIISSLESSLLSIHAETSNKQKVSPVSTVCDPYWEDLKEQTKEGGTIRLGLSTGIEAIDYMTTGIRPQQMWTVAGRTGEGKSCIAAQTIAAVCSSGGGVYLATPEMTREQTLERILIQNAGVPAWKFYRKNKLNDTDKFNIRRTLDEIKRWNLHIDDSSCITADEIWARARILEKRDGVGLCIVDYVQIVDGKGRDIKERVSNISTRMRALAKDVMPTMVLSQMPRPDRSKLNDWPTKYDLKESGSLENDSSVILMIFRKVDEDTKLPVGEDYLIIPKQRYGKVGHQAALLHPDSLRFEARGTD